MDAYLNASRVAELWNKSKDNFQDKEEATADYWDSYVANSILAWGNWQHQLADRENAEAIAKLRKDIVSGQVSLTMATRDGIPMKTDSGEYIKAWRETPTS